MSRGDTKRQSVCAGAHGVDCFYQLVPSAVDLRSNVARRNFGPWRCHTCGVLQRTDPNLYPMFDNALFAQVFDAPWKPLPWPTIGAVYFARAGKERVKIGWSKANLRKRLQEVQLGCPYQIELLAVIPGADEEVEDKYHRRFKSEKCIGEWFLFTEAIAIEIRKIRLLHRSPKGLFSFGHCSKGQERALENAWTKALAG